MKKICVVCAENFEVKRGSALTCSTKCSVQRRKETRKQYKITNREKCREDDKILRSKNREKDLERQRRWRVENRERVNKLSRIRRAKNPDAAREYRTKFTIALQTLKTLGVSL